MEKINGWVDDGWKNRARDRWMEKKKVKLTDGRGKRWLGIHDKRKWIDERRG